MEIRRRIGLALCLTLAFAIGVFARDKPEVEETPFKSIPVGLFYLDDTDIAFISDPEARITYRTTDAGVTWSPLKGVERGKVIEVLKHPYNNNVVIVIGLQDAHWISKDQGETWKKWHCPGMPTMSRPAISFHATNPDRMLYHTAECHGISCEEKVYYTTNGFDSDPRKLHDDAVTCIWSKSTELFTTGDEDTDLNQIMCVVKGAFNPFANNYRLVTSTDFFQNEEIEPVMDEGRTVSGIMNLAAVKSYIVAAAKSEGTTELAMYVTDGSGSWHRAEFGEHKLEEDAYTLLESTNYSMQVDVLTTKPTNPMGVLLTSNSNGTFFTKNIEHTNRNVRGFVDFEKIQNIQGIVMVNVVDNYAEVEQNWITDKQVKSQISFDDGRTWRSLKVDDDDLHLHSVTQQRNMGRIFSSPAPGIVMGIGNTGKYLRDYSDGDLYVSDDAGFTWTKALGKPHLYEFGDQGAILVAIEDGETDKIKWSLNHGEDWEDMELEDKIQPIGLTTVPDSTSLTFILTATKGRGSDREFFIYSLNFDGLHKRVCKKDDFEDWYARTNKKGEPTCIMGHTQKFRRRKKDKKCFVAKRFKDPLPETEDCKCKDRDFECDYENGFNLKDGTCQLTGPMKAPEGACQGSDKTFMGSSGYRLIPGNTCVKSGGVEKDKPVERKCNLLNKPVASGKISSEITKFTGDSFVEYYYLERLASNRGRDETVIMRTDRREVYVTHDHGKKWQQIFSDEEIVAIYPHQYLTENVYLITPSETVHYSKDRAQGWHSFKAPDKPNQDHIQILSFHPTQPEWLIWTGSRDCSGGTCQTIARVSTKGGDDWEKLLPAVRKCQFVYREGRADSDQLVYCEQYVNEDPSETLTLLSSSDWFEHKDVLKRDVINFATMAEYIVVAVRDSEQQTLQVDTSIDGKVFADAKFPPNFNVPHQQAYTVLDSSTHAVFLHVTVNNLDGSEYGSIIKSNSNGTSYVMAVSEVNRNSPGYVDFEKMQGLEGVAVINRVANAKEADAGKQKKLKTYMTHNDGADWALIRKPENAPKDASWCAGGVKQCSLHLHGYTERKDPRDTFSSASAVGLMIATGNVGEYLGPKKNADTFITRDGGVNWHFAAPGNWMWEYGDMGSVIVLVKEDVPTSEVLYSLDEGENWISYQFSNQEMMVSDITTVPSDTSLNFLVWGKIGGEIATINLDFSGLDERSKQCRLNEQKPTGPNSDYDLWSPSHPNSKDNCLFGHVAQYHRKKVDRNCYNGRVENHLHGIQENCTCTRADFECDYNYERQNDGSCRLVKGLQPADPMEVCKDPQAVEYYDITGYRKIPLSTCQGGREMAFTSTSHPCPGKEEVYKKRHGLSGVGLFFAIVLPIAAAAGAGYWVWKNWEGKFGRIRLGDGANPLATSTGYNAFDRDAPWVKYPVMAVSGVVAVVAAIPMLVGSLWKIVSTRLGRGRSGYTRTYNSRSSFARGRGDYSAVVEEDGELLGEDSDEDI